MNKNGTNKRPLVDAASNKIHGTHLRWSPDGKQLLYSYYTGVGSHWESYIIDVNVATSTGTNQRMIRDYAVVGAWSPDGSRVVLNDTNGNGVWILNSNGSGTPYQLSTYAYDYVTDWGGSAPPKVLVSIDPLDGVGSGGWYNLSSSGSDGVLVHASASHPAGIAQLTCKDGSATLFQVNADRRDFTLTDGSHAISCSATSNDGNSGVSLDSTPMPVNVQVDQAPPIITASATTADGLPYTPGVWTNQTVTVHYTCSDATSGVKTCPADEVVSADYNDSSVNGAAMDNADNNTTIAFGPILIDNLHAIIQLLDSQGGGLAEGTAKYYDSGWKSVAGATDSYGVLHTDIPVSKGSVTFRMTYGGGIKDRVQNIANDSLVIFRTTLVSVELRDHAGSFIADGGTVKYYANGWRDFGAASGGSVSKELLPISYTFRMEYGGGVQDKAENVAVNSTVTFQTAPVTVELRDHTGVPIAGNATAKYYANGWKDFGTTTTGSVSKELLPINYTFRMEYAGGVQDMAQNVATNQTVTFQTALVTVELKDHTGSFLADSATAKYYANGWKDFGITISGTVTKELLPINYTFRMEYAGGVQDKAQNVATNQTVTFQTALVTAELRDHTGAFLAGNATVKYYANGWKDFGTTITGTVTKELLPLSYTFRMGYAGGLQDKVQNAGSNPLVVFQTGAVHSNSGSCTRYYASGWQPFQQDMELLPISYPFRFSDGTTDTTYSITAGVTNPIH